MMYIPAATRRPHIFLSHSSENKNFVRQLANDLNNCEIDVWLDEWEISPGDSIYKQISKGIQSSKYVALVMSGAFLNSKWVSEEVESAFARQMEEKNKVILPLMLEQVNLPELLKGKLYISFIDNYYEGLTRLACLLHDVEQRAATEAILNYSPTSLNGAIDCLRYCDIDPYMIIPREVFDELANTKQVEVEDNRLRISNVYHILNNFPLSPRTRKFLEKL